MIPYDVENIPKDPKEFALFAIGPYFKDPKQCGHNGLSCVYKTQDGRRCVAGRFFKPKNLNLDIDLDYLFNSGEEQSDLFIPGVVNILTDTQWVTLQALHDAIAVNLSDIDFVINELKLFTPHELQAYAAALPE